MRGAKRRWSGCEGVWGCGSWFLEVVSVRHCCLRRLMSIVDTSISKMWNKLVMDQDGSEASDC